MSLAVLIVPDKFKGTLTANQAARSIAAGWRRARPRDHLDLLPMSDGGDGFGSILSQLIHAKPRSTSTLDAAHRPCRARWWWAPSKHVAIIESARVIGLAMLPHARFHPFDLDTAGVGQLLLSVAKQGARSCLVGIGGSATNDGGFGMARALGWTFLDRTERPITRWPDLTRLHSIQPPRPAPLRQLHVTVAVDVQNLLLGPRGATRVYGPQKGLRPDDMQCAQAALRQLARVCRRHFNVDHASQPGSGAAGGLGFALMAFVQAKPVPGSDLFAHYAALDRRLAKADLVITGEGTLDKSSLMGKGIGDVAQRCRKSGIPCIGLAGALQDRQILRTAFNAIHAIAPDLAPPSQALRRPAHYLAKLSQRVASCPTTSALDAGR
jgi:glycerate 2-kinase